MSRIIHPSRQKLKPFLFQRRVKLCDWQVSHRCANQTADNCTRSSLGEDSSAQRLHLRNAGHDVISISEESPGIPDDQVVARAVAEQRISLTFDRDYGELIYRSKMPSSAVLYLRYDPSTPQEPAHHILRLLQIASLALPHRFTVADRERVRQRPLPK